MLYYTLKNGRVVSECDVQKAYEITTGKTYMYDNPECVRWLYSLCGNSIVRARKKEDMTIEDFLDNGLIIEAVRLYRVQNDCSLREAKDAIDLIREQMKVDKT